MKLFTLLTFCIGKRIYFAPKHRLRKYGSYYYISSKVVFSPARYLRQSNETATSIQIQKQPPRGILKKRCSENVQQIYRRTTMLKCNFNKVAKQFYWNSTLAWIFSCKFAVYFQNNFSWEHLWVATSVDLHWSCRHCTLTKNTWQ